MIAAKGIEPRHPFLDKRLVELCLAVPGHLKYGGGLGRGVMREAMKKILPEAVRLRQSKIDFSSFIVDRLENKERKLLEDLLFNKQEQINLYLNKNNLEKEYREFLNPQNNPIQRRRKARILSRIAFLSIWLS